MNAGYSSPTFFLGVIVQNFLVLIEKTFNTELRKGEGNLLFSKKEGHTMVKK